MKKRKVISVALAVMLSCSMMDTVVNAELIKGEGFEIIPTPSVIALTEETEKLCSELNKKGYNIDPYVLESCRDCEKELLMNVKSEEEFLFIKGLLIFRDNLGSEYNVFDTQDYYNTRLGIGHHKYNAGIEGMFALWGIPLNYNSYTVNGNVRLPVGLDDYIDGIVTNDGVSWKLDCKLKDKSNYQFIESDGKFYINDVQIDNYKKDKVNTRDLIYAILKTMYDNRDNWSIETGVPYFDSDKIYYYLNIKNKEEFLKQVEDEMGVIIAEDAENISVHSYTDNDSEDKASVQCVVSDKDGNTKFDFGYTDSLAFYSDKDRGIDIGGHHFSALTKNVQQDICGYNFIDFTPYHNRGDNFFDIHYKYKTVQADGKYYVVEGNNVLVIEPHNIDKVDAIKIPEVKKTYETVTDYLRGKKVEDSDSTNIDDLLVDIDSGENEAKDINIDINIDDLLVDIDSGENKTKDISEFSKVIEDYCTEFDALFNMTDIFNLRKQKTYDLAFNGVIGGKTLKGNVLQFDEGSCLLLNKTPLLFAKDSNVYSTKKKFETNDVVRICNTFNNLNITQNDVKYIKDKDVYICTNEEITTKFLKSVDVNQKEGYNYILEFAMLSYSDSDYRKVKVYEYKNTNINDIIKSGKLDNVLNYDGDILDEYSVIKYDGYDLDYKISDILKSKRKDSNESIDFIVGYAYDVEEAFPLTLTFDLSNFDGTVALGNSVYDVSLNLQKLHDKHKIKFEDVVNKSCIDYTEYDNMKTCFYTKDDTGIYIENIGTDDADSFVVSNVYVYNTNFFANNNDSYIVYHDIDSLRGTRTYGYLPKMVNVLTITKNGNAYNYESSTDSLKGKITLQPTTFKHKEIILPTKYQTYNLSVEKLIQKVLNNKYDLLSICISKTPSIENSRFVLKTKLKEQNFGAMEVPCDSHYNIDEPEEPMDLKPVIYLYPDKDNTEVTVNLDYAGEFTAVYPEFTNNTEWTVTANKDSSIVLNNREYNYLYWEGTRKSSDKYIIKSGTCVAKEDTVKFLEEKLTQLGLTEKEQDDFISFWLPKLNKSAYNVISFDTEQYESIAHLHVAPNPDKVIRVFMTYQGTDKFVDISEEVIDVDITRNGFTVVEWGGGAGVITPEYVS